jgi:hypothetical protein
MGVLVKLLPQLLPLLATQAAKRALANAGNRADEIDALVISTCTGYLCPGLTRCGKPTWSALPADYTG